MHVRCYQAGGSDDALLRDFLSIVGAEGRPVDLAALERPARLNRRRSLAAVIAAREQTLRVTYARSRILPDTQFTPLTLADLAEMPWYSGRRRTRFSDVTACAFPPCPPRRCSEMVTALIGGPQSRRNKNLIRSVVDALEIAA